jgi:hypothetical protein
LADAAKCKIHPENACGVPVQIFQITKPREKKNIIKIEGLAPENLDSLKFSTL